jgi:Fe-S-cluster containining protein
MTRKDILWLACREKTCCHATKVVISGADLWRITTTLAAPPWEFALYADAAPQATDGFCLEAGGPAYQIVLAKRGAVGPEGAPCVFLWKLRDGHAQCGLGALRPLVCQAYPAVLVDGLLAADSHPCTCRRWSLGDLAGDEDRARIAGILTEAAEYAEVVAAWNAALPARPGGAATYREFCDFVISAYAARRVAVPA